MKYELTLPLKREAVQKLNAGDVVTLTGTLYTGRDQAHRRMNQLLERGEALPFDIKDQTIYYVGPCPAKPGEPIGSCGPTTSCRVDGFVPRLLELGLVGMIGKGKRSPQVIQAMIKNGAVYFSATGGAGALLAQTVVSCQVVAFPELLSEAIYKIEVNGFPAVVAIDARGNSLYERRN